MGNMLTIVGGVAAVILGVIGLVTWRDSLFTLLKGSIPAFLLLGGIIALMAGLSETKESRREHHNK